jgi:hypothetical protein
MSTSIILGVQPWWWLNRMRPKQVWTRAPARCGDAPRQHGRASSSPVITPAKQRWAATPEGQDYSTSSRNQTKLKCRDLPHNLLCYGSKVIGGPKIPKLAGWRARLGLVEIGAASTLPMPPVDVRSQAVKPRTRWIGKAVTRCSNRGEWRRLRRLGRPYIGSRIVPADVQRGYSSWARRLAFRTGRPWLGRNVPRWDIMSKA